MPDLCIHLPNSVFEETKIWLPVFTQIISWTNEEDRQCAELATDELLNKKRKEQTQ